VTRVILRKIFSFSFWLKDQLNTVFMKHLRKQTYVTGDLIHLALPSAPSGLADFFSIAGDNLLYDVDLSSQKAVNDGISIMWRIAAGTILSLLS